MSQKVGPFGGNNGDTFDDGVFCYDDVKKVIVGENVHGVTSIKIEYAKDGKIRDTSTRKYYRNLKEFAVNYPEEYIISIQGTYSNVGYYGTTIVKTLTFKTSHGRTSPMFGKMAIFNTAFIVEGKGGAKIMGFHGRSGDVLDAIGAHFLVSSSPLKQVEPRGGNGGSAWDDGVYDGIRKILVRQDGKRLSHVKFEYVKGTISIPHSHGTRKQEPQEFMLDYPNEHVTSVEGIYDGFVTSLTFKTSKGKTSPTFGLTSARRPAGKNLVFTSLFVSFLLIFTFLFKLKYLLILILLSII